MVQAAILIVGGGSRRSCRGVSGAGGTGRMTASSDWGRVHLNGDGVVAMGHNGGRKTATRRSRRSGRGGHMPDRWLWPF